MKKLFSYLREYKKQTVLAPLFKLFEVVLELSVPFIVAVIIDRGIGGSDKGTVVKWSLVLCLFAAVGLGFAVTAQYFAAKAATGFACNIREALFFRIQDMSYADIDRLGVSALITNITSDVNQMQNGLNLTLRLVLRSPFVVVGAIAACFMTDPGSALYLAAAVPVLLAVIYVIMLAGVRLYGKVQTALSLMVRRIRENLTGVRVLRAFGKEKDETAAFDSENGDYVRKQRRSGRISALLNPVSYVVINLAVIALVGSGAVKVNEGSLTTGDVVAMYNLSAMIIVELIKIADFTINLTKAVSSGKRVAAVLSEEITMEYPEKPAEQSGDIAVKMTGVSFSYGGKNVLENVDLTIREGQTVGIIGGTGSGKTSLISLICRSYDPGEGKVELFGADAKDLNREQLSETVRVVPQKAVLFSGTVRSNLCFGLGERTDEEMNEALKAACADGVVAEKGGLDAKVEQNGRNFSGGQKQRLTVAAALLRRPRILILDDSSSALDYATDAEMRENISKIKGVTLINVAQRVSTVRGCDMIAVLDEGRIAGVGTHEELLKNCAVYRGIYESQTEKSGEESA
ncbi:MAG: ABC transporter ATP-binding protein [Clostridia bacterium]|nr:ABC transporter ATP-binding protein [Clostridia bacterium]